MISEAKIMLGEHRDEYIVLPVTLLCSLTTMRIACGKIERKLSWTKPFKGTQWLLVDGEFAFESRDNTCLRRDTDRYGLRSISYGEVARK